MDWKNYCGRCKRREKCIQVCSKVEKYLSKGWKNQREFTIANPDNFPGTLGSYDFDILPDFPKIKMRIFTLFRAGYSRKQVAEKLDITRECLRQHIRQMKKKVNFQAIIEGQLSLFEGATPDVTKA